MRARTRWLAVAALLLAGCSSDPLTRTEFTEQANRRCAEANQRLDEALAEARAEAAESPPAGEQEQQFFATVTAELRAQLDDLRSLRPPEAIAEDVDAMLTAAESALEELDEAGPGAFAAEQDPFERANELAAGLGLDDCAG